MREQYHTCELVAFLIWPHKMSWWTRPFPPNNKENKKTKNPKNGSSKPKQPLSVFNKNSTLKQNKKCTDLDLVTPVAGSIFGLLSQTHLSKSEFKNEILKCALLDNHVTLLCVCGVDSFIPEWEHLMKKLLHGLFSKKNSLKSDSWIQTHEMKLRSTSSAEKNFADEITWITWKTEQNLEIWPFFNSLLERWVWENVQKLIWLPAPVSSTFWN